MISNSFFIKFNAINIFIRDANYSTTMTIPFDTVTNCELAFGFFPLALERFGKEPPGKIGSLGIAPIVVTIYASYFDISLVAFLPK
jgi:hypothetical protein